MAGRLFAAHRLERMHDDLPPDLPRLEALETYLVLALARVREKKADLERREAERQRGVEARPAPPDWTIEYGLNRNAPPVAVHMGDCHMAGKRVKGVDRDAARRARHSRGVMTDTNPGRVIASDQGCGAWRLSARAVSVRAPYLLGSGSP
jgi:hypothetical protein